MVIRRDSGYPSDCYWGDPLMLKFVIGFAVALVFLILRPNLSEMMLVGHQLVEWVGMFGHKVVEWIGELGTYLLSLT